MKARLVPGKPGQFDVLVDGEVVASKDPVGFVARLLGNRGIPDEARVVEAVRARLGG